MEMYAISENSNLTHAAKNLFAILAASAIPTSNMIFKQKNANNLIFKNMFFYLVWLQPRFDRSHGFFNFKNNNYYIF